MMKHTCLLRRRQRLSFIQFATAAAALAAVSVTSAFQGSQPFQQRSGRAVGGPSTLKSRRNFEEQRPVVSRIAFLPFAVADTVSEAVLDKPRTSSRRQTRATESSNKASNRRTRASNGGMSGTTRTRSPIRRDVELYIFADDMDRLSSSSSLSNEDKRQKLAPVRFNGLSTSATNNKGAIMKMKNPTQKKSRSSTMPGFSAETDKQRAYRDGIRLVEKRTGKKVKETAKEKRSRQKYNGEAMYRNSASVPDSLVKFADEIHNEDRITRDEEKELGEKTQEAIRLQRLYDNLEVKLQREPTDAEWCAAAGKINMEMIRQEIEEGLEAKNKLVTSNLRLVQSVVNTYIRNGLTAQYNAGDMMQEGVMALIRAAEKFDPERGFAFATYALYWVRASVKRSQIYQSRIITVPPRLYENHKRLRRVEKDLFKLWGRKPTKKELGEAVGMSELQVDRCLTAMQQKCFSLDQDVQNSKKPMTEHQSGRDTLIELVESRTNDGEQKKNELTVLREHLIDTLHKHLKPDEVELLLLRYGLKDGPSHKFGRQLSIAELSNIVGLKPDKVRRTINHSLKYLSATGGSEWLTFQREFM